MAWGDGKPEGNGGNSCPQASHPPTPLALGRSTSTCRRTSSEWPSSLDGLIASVGRKTKCPAPARYHRRCDVDRCECSSGGASRQLRLYVALRLPTPPGEHYPKPLKIPAP